MRDSGIKYLGLSKLIKLVSLNIALGLYLFSIKYNIFCENKYFIWKIVIKNIIF